MEMAWGSLQHDAALHWSPTALLDASVEVLVAFLVLICTLLNFVTSSFIRVSGFHIPCSCCAHLQKGPSINAVRTSQNGFASRKPNSISAPIVSVLGLGDSDHSDEYSREVELNKPADLSRIHSIAESTCEASLEVFPKGGATSEDTSAQRSEQVKGNLNDQSEEDVNSDQYAKDQELLHALQSERETMAALYSELEEERNSSATAASEALAMISRLQEEKAAVQMEARQFQRMVMEKAMYDQEAIEVLKEILAKREEERMALEEEMRLYRDRLEALLMEERDSADRAGRDHVPMLLLEGTTLDEKAASPKFERTKLPTMVERISPNARLAKDEEAEFLDRLNKTKSQLLTALLQEGIPEPASAFVESEIFANEIHEAMAKIPVRAESLPILDHESNKDSLGLGATKIGREIGLPIPPKVPKQDSVKGDEEAADKPVPAIREVDLPTSPITEKQIEKALAEDDGKLADEPVSASLEVDLPALSLANVKENEKKSSKDDGKAAGAPELNSLLSLKRRWNARGSQEVSVETLAKAKEDRRIEEKRLSVLEYVRNLEEQLQQQAGKPPAQVTRARSVDGREHTRARSVDGTEQDATFKTPSQDESSSVSVTSGSSGGPERDDLVQRRLFVDGDSLEKDFQMNTFQDERDDMIYAHQYSFNAEIDAKVSNDDEEFNVSAGKSEKSPNEALVVHDVYEVQNHPNASQSKFGVWVAGTKSGLEVQSLISDRLGKPDNLNVEEEHSRNSNERERQFLSNAIAFPQEDEDSGFETEWRDIQRTQYTDLRISTSLRKEISRSLVEEVEQLTYRLKALEADRYLMKQTIDSLRRENGEMKLIQEIAQQLRELRGMEQNEMQLMDVSPHSLQFQVHVTAP